MSVTPDPLRQEVSLMYVHHHGWLRAWLNKKLGDNHQASDLAHDTFVQLLSRTEVIAAKEPRAFLLTVAQRVLLNHRRRARLEQAYLEALAGLPQEVVISTEERVMLLQALLEIDKLLAGLPLVVRRAFLLSQVDGMKHGQVASELGVSVATVKRYLAKAAYQFCFAGLTSSNAALDGGGSSETGACS